MKNSELGVTLRIRQLQKMKSVSIQDFSDQIEMPKGTVEKYLQLNRAPNSEFLAAVTDRFGVSASWILSGVGPMYLADVANEERANAPEFVPIPKFTVSASAGNGIQNGPEDAVGHYAFDRRWLRQRGLKPDRLAIITVSGDSMEPKLRNQDMILVDLDQRSASDGKTYVIRIGDELLVKHIQRISPSSIDLISANATYPPRTVDLSKERDSVQIIGKVVASMQDWV